MFVLQDTWETKIRNRPVYFKGQSGIGPMYTEDLEQAEKFRTKMDAVKCPAFMHPLCFFEPTEIKDQKQP